jgi:hypothetical protein
MSLNILLIMNEIESICTTSKAFIKLSLPYKELFSQCKIKFKLI